MAKAKKKKSSRTKKPQELVTRTVHERLALQLHRAKAARIAELGPDDVKALQEQEVRRRRDERTGQRLHNKRRDPERTAALLREYMRWRPKCGSDTDAFKRVATNQGTRIRITKGGKRQRVTTAWTNVRDHVRDAGFYPTKKSDVEKWRMEARKLESH